MTPRKAGVLAMGLAGRPDSLTAAAVSGWERPASREALVLMDLFDVTAAAASEGKAKPYPRPWPTTDTSSKRLGNTNLSRAEVLAILNAHGHNLN